MVLSIRPSLFRPLETVILNQIEKFIGKQFHPLKSIRELHRLKLVPDPLQWPAAGQVGTLASHSSSSSVVE